MPITINGNGAISGLGDIDGHDLETATLVVSGDTTIAPQAVGRATLFVDESTNRLGINTTTPTRLVQVSDVNPIISVTETATSKEILLGANANAGFVGTETNHDFRLITNGVDRVAISTNGNVGINTTSPAFLLDVNQPSTYGLRVGGNGGGGNYHLEMGQRSLNGSPGINAVGTSTSLVFEQNGDESGRFDSTGKFRVTRSGTNSIVTSSDGTITAASQVKINLQLTRLNGLVANQTNGICFNTQYTSSNTVRRVAFFGAERDDASNGSQIANFVMELCQNQGSNITTGDPPNSGNTQFRFKRNSILQICNNGGGIDFSASEGANATSSILNDYEEGTWTPEYGCSGNNLNLGGGTQIVNFATYVKVGKFVSLNFQLALNNATSISGTGELRINGLPFLPDNSSNNFYSGTATFTKNGWNGTGDRAISNIELMLQNGFSFMRFVEKEQNFSGTTWATVSDGLVATAGLNSNVIVAAITYQTNQ